VTSVKEDTYSVKPSGSSSGVGETIGYSIFKHVK
jgi:hypothetical protein